MSVEDAAAGVLVCRVTMELADMTIDEEKVGIIIVPPADALCRIVIDNRVGKISNIDWLS